ncbi:MAG TPA: hypothetical protein VLL54_07415 [Pyrinomonadaceae bacterium]|nr:hypothetical protein [Pyrinomonadaceae bacterium]
MVANQIDNNGETKLHREEPDGDIDFSKFNEGMKEPSLGKRIKFLIIHKRDFIVYIDDENFVEWATNNQYGPYPDGLGEVVNRVGHLEALSMTLVPPKHRLPFRRLLGESLARTLTERKPKNALLILKQAEDYMIARSRETARTWYLSAASVVTILITIVVAVLWWRRTGVVNSLGKTGFELVLGAGVGSLGALMSVITRSNQISMDAAAGWKIHYLEASARIFVGVIGAFFIALAIKANLVLGSVNTVNSLPLLLAICIVAGASERFVPDLIKQIEGRVSSDDAKTKLQSEPTPPDEEPNDS